MHDRRPRRPRSGVPTPVQLAPCGPHEAVVLEEAGLKLGAVRDWSGQRVPLEVSRLGPSAARICFTDDVDELAGRWAPVGELTLPSAACTAGVPFCRGETYRVVFDLLPGRFRAGDIPARATRMGVPRIACRGSRKRFASLRGSVLMGVGRRLRRRPSSRSVFDLAGPGSSQGDRSGQVPASPSGLSGLGAVVIHGVVADGGGREFPPGRRHRSSRWSLASMTTPGFVCPPVGGAGFGPAGL